VARRLVRAASAAILVATTLLCWQIARRLYADVLRSEASLSSIDRAIRLDPRNPELYRIRAQLLELEGRSGKEAWTEAARLDSRNPRLLIPAGLAAEMHGDLTGAERHLLDAARFNRQWMAPWSLAAFMQRHGRGREAIQWLRVAFERGDNRDLRAAFDLAAQIEPDPAKMLADAVPDDAVALRGFVPWLLETPVDGPRAQVAVAAATKLFRVWPNRVRFSPPVETALYASRRLAEAGFGREARAVWDEACRAKLLRCSVPTGGSLLVNSALDTELYQDGLDWRLAANPGIEAIHHPGSGTLKYRFSGQQSETAELLSQPVVIEPGQSWRIRFDYLVRDISRRQSGFGWAIGRNVYPIEPPLTSEIWQEAACDLPPVESRWVGPLRLVYRRPPGGTRVEGELWVRNIQAAATSPQEAK
jgi:tetratricopeptide (TPR) repeat protein